MRFKKGSKVEVLSKEEVPTGSWLCAEIISGNGHTYSVRYGGIPMTSSEAIVERVPRKAMRPSPPPVEGLDNWVTGDLVEVLIQNMSWKTATIVQALGGNNFLVRLLGKSQKFRAHGSLLRVRQCWKDDKWFMVGKGDAHCTTSMKRNQTDPNTKLYNVMRARAIENGRRPKRISEKVDSYTHISNASSSGSCSVNGKVPYKRPFTSVKYENEDTAESLCSDAESFCGGGYEEEDCNLSKIEEFVVQDHIFPLPFFSTDIYT